MVRSLCFAVAVMIVACAPCFAQTCPSSTLIALGTSVSTGAAARTVSASDWCYNPTYVNARNATANIHLATGGCYATAQAPVECAAGAQVHAHDVFTLSGPGTSPIAFNALLAIHASETAFDANYALASLTEGAANRANFRLTVANRDTGIAITIVRAPGQSFDLFVDLQAWGGGAYTGAAGSIYTTVSFPDLPLSYSLTSCHGYYQAGAIVQARETTWGRVKTLYR